MSPPVSRAETKDLVQLQPIASPTATDASWWEKADGPPALSSQEVLVVPAPELASYLASALIAQCPNCGAFGLEASRLQAGDGWDFRCESCDFHWPWQPGKPWPPVGIRPGRRKQSGPPAP
jgi:predicted RNA-binding Zn-ribbon protein involved in translation (DUF1610 family)